jgi:hypothetical protein
MNMKTRLFADFLDFSACLGFWGLFFTAVMYVLSNT